MAILEQLQATPNDPALLMDLSVMEQVLGDKASGLRRQAEALAQQCLYRSSWPASEHALHILAFLAAGDIGTNTPLAFLLQGSDTVLYMLYVRPGQALPADLPPHDIAIVTIGESDETRPVLELLARETAFWPCRVLNQPSRVLTLARETLATCLAGIAGLVMPETVRIDRAQLGALERCFPLIVRPVGSHAGRGLEKCACPDDMAAYLAAHDDVEFTIAGYVDYRSHDGLFRKYRIVWVDGTPYPCHMAICAEWKVWYLNADMAENAANRSEEAHFMTDFRDGFARRHAPALAAIHARLGLEYFGIDCAETRDGQLLVFEGDISLIVHDLDSVEIFPYKQPAMQRLFAVYQAMLRRLAMRLPGSEMLLQA
jgi:glutathione synthase/RimK-type ligase-like ATP-grasp enzyme